MAGARGMGTAVWGSIAFVFRAEDGLTESGPVVPDVNCTPAGAVDELWEGGDVIDHGTVDVTAITQYTIDDAALIGTTDTLVLTYPKTVSTNTTAATRTGSAIFLGSPKEGAKNSLNVGQMSFRWKAKPTYVVESA